MGNILLPRMGPATGSPAARVGLPLARGRWARSARRGLLLPVLMWLIPSVAEATAPLSKRGATRTLLPATGARPRAPRRPETREEIRGKSEKRWCPAKRDGLESVGDADTATLHFSLFTFHFFLSPSDRSAGSPGGRRPAPDSAAGSGRRRRCRCRPGGDPAPGRNSRRDRSACG